MAMLGRHHPARCLQLVAVLLLVNLARGQECVWDKEVDYPPFPPLVYDRAVKSLVYPTLEGTSRVVRVAAGAEVALACPTTTISNLGVAYANATCAGGKLLLVNGVEWLMAELGCASKAKEEIVRNLGVCGSDGRASLYAIGFRVEPTYVYTTIQVCFEPVEETNIYSHHVLNGASVTAMDPAGNRPSMKQSTGFFTVSVNTCYLQASQQTLMVNLLGDAALAATIIDIPSNKYFSRGHITPDSDFILLAEQEATFYYINAHPQWQICNSGNWANLENDIRSLGDSHKTLLHIYTGSSYTLALDDINGVPVPIYLGLTENQTVIPAPQLLWKVVHEPSTGRGVAVVSVNNPHLTVAPTPLCTDICASVSWIKYVTSDLLLGYSYCCTVEEFRTAVPDAPDIGPVGLLDS